MIITSHGWTDNFREFFVAYSSNNNNSRTIIISYCNSYLSHHNLENLVFERVSNYNNNLLSCNLWNLDPKNCFNRKNQFLSFLLSHYTNLSSKSTNLNDDLFIGISDLTM